MSGHTGGTETPRGRNRAIAFLLSERDSRLDKVLIPVIIAVLLGVPGALFTLSRSSDGRGGGASPAPQPSSTTSAPTAKEAGTAGGNGGSAAIYHQGPLTIAYNTCADTDAPPSDPQWGFAASYQGGAVDICSESPSFVGINAATLVTVKSGSNTSCQNATGWLPPNGYADLHLSVGSFLCIHTNQDRYSLLRVEAIDSVSNAVTFFVKTFSSP